LGNESVWGEFQNTTHLLALIRPWRTDGQDAALALEAVTFKHTLAPIITDLRNVRGVVGRIKSRGEWGIADRSTGFARAAFVVDEALDVDTDSDS